MSEPMKVEICEHCGKPGDYPVCTPPYNSRHSRIKELEESLTAETQRRVAAEAVVDAHWHENEAQLLADAYREKYPAESTMTACNIHEHDGAFKCLSHRRKWGAVLRPDDPCKGWVKP